MFLSSDLPPTWTRDHQRVHTLCWSAFLGIPSGFDVTRFRKRYRPLSAGRTIELLLARSRSTTAPPLRPALWKLVLWALAPWVCGGGPREREPWGADAGLESIAPAFRLAFAQAFDFEPAADGAWDGSRFLVPEMPDLGIEGASIQTWVARRAVRMRMETIVKRPLAELRCIVDPSGWSASPFWADMPAQCTASTNGGPEVIDATVRMPGGDRADPSKHRRLELKIDRVTSAFEERIDYEGWERWPKEPPPSRIVRPRPPRDGAQQQRVQALSGADAESATPVSYLLRPWTEIDRLRGYLRVEKASGRPGTCCVTAEREVRFVDFNHEHFCAETTMYWLGSELVGYLDRAVQG